MKRTRLLAALRLVLPAITLIARMAAQDVTVSPSEWVYPDDPPDQLPVLRHPLRPDIPGKAHNAEEIGYSTHDVFVDERGRVLSATLHTTAPAFEHDGYLQQVEGSASMSAMYHPAKRAGKPVNSQIHFAVIFNPASAAASGPEATPRLLDAYPIIDPKWRPAASSLSVNQYVVWATVSVDEAGRPGAVKGAPEDVAPLLDKGVKVWRFAPARSGGQPVAREVRVPFVITDIELAKDQVPPRAIRQSPPVYPYEMRKSRLRGEVVVDFIVDIEGNVRRAHVVRSLNPAFDQPALDSVNSWVFEPGRRNGVPVFSHMQVPVFFSLMNTADGGGDPLVVEKSARQSTLPEDLRVDVEPKIRGLVSPVYPYDLLRGEVGGSAQVNYVVDPQGNVAVTKVVNADRPEFGLALQAAVERFEFDPALKDGRPNRAALGFKQDFDPYGSLVSKPDSRLLHLEQKHPERIARTGDLDAPPKALVTRSPVFPRSLAGSVLQGKALIDVLVDEDGSPHLARVVSATDPAFGYAAVQAVSLWQFAPPTSKGLGVVAMVRIPFEFKPPSPEAARGGEQ
jgi:TonB family protein